MAQDGVTTSPYPSRDEEDFAVVALVVEVVVGGIATDVDGSVVEIVAA